MFDYRQITVFFKKSFHRKDLILILLLLFLYFHTRLIYLDRFPIFTDEGIYIRWAKVAWHDASWRFISLTDGKQPLQTWAIIPFLKLFPNNTLLAGRLFSVTAGFISLIGIFSLLFYLFGKKSAFIAAFLYIFIPYFLFYDRMALTDSAVNAGAIWVLFFSILLIKTLRLDIALIFGLISGFVLLTKSSSKMFVAMTGLAPTLLNWKRGVKKNLDQLINFFILFFLVLLIALILYNVQRLSPFFHYIAEKNKTFVMTVDEFLQAPFAAFWVNFKSVLLDVFWESGWIMPIIGILGFFRLKKLNPNLAFYLSLWIVLPLLVISSFSKVVFPRYLIFFAGLFLIPASYFLSQLKTKNLLIVSFFLSIFLISFDYPILFDFAKIPFPPVERGQYIEGPPAGWGVKDIIEYARKKSKEKPVLILAEGNFGLVADMLDAYLKPDDRIEIRGLWPFEEKHIYENLKELETRYVYAVFPHRTNFPGIWPVKLIKKYEKPGKKSAIFLFELTK